MSHPYVAAAAESFVLVLLCGAAAGIDKRTMILPTSINVALGAAGLTFQSLREAALPTDALLGILVGATIPIVVREVFFRLRSVEGLGLGDVKFMAAAGAWTGWNDFPVFLLVSSIAGLMYAVSRYALLRPVGLSERIPFGPFLAIGLLATVAARNAIGHPIIDMIGSYLWLHGSSGG
jgi:leader peptidase (prepilin peptidase)/N-methyltransferase